MSHTPFQVPVRELPTHRRVEIEGPFVAAALAGLTVRDALERPADDREAGGGVLDVELYADGHTVFANGTLKGRLVVACGRCVGPVELRLDEKIHVTYLPGHVIEADDAEADAAAADAPAAAGADGDDEAGVQLDEEDLDLYPYDGEVVDLEPLVREQFVLAVPYAPLCREDCKGLCPQCGADKNVAPCACEKPVDPRFEALRGLKLPS